MSLKYEKINESKKYITRFQFFFIPLAKIVSWVLVDKERQRIDVSPKQLNPSTNYVIVANHQSMFDPFLICYSLPFGVHTVLSPYRFFVVNRMFNHWWLRPWLFSFGCFPAKWHKRYKYGITYASELNANNQTLVIFPEGRVSRIDREYTPKRGIELLANKKSTMLIPARIKWGRRKRLFKSYSLSIGQPFDAMHMTAEQIMDVVYSLKFR